jgi:hypothetical protein
VSEPLDAFVVTSDSDVIFCLDSDLRITSCNPGWDRFAVDNGAPGLCGPALIGRSILDCMTEPVRAYYALKFGRVLAEAQPWEHLYECSSSVLYREFRSLVLPLTGRAGLMVINCLQVQHAHEHVQFGPTSERYRDNRGQIKMCCGCRRTRRWALGEETWECVPHFVETMPPDVTHGICPSCLKHYYPDEG